MNKRKYGPGKQVDPSPGVRKILAEFLENVVKAHPSFCQV